MTEILEEAAKQLGLEVIDGWLDVTTSSDSTVLKNVAGSSLSFVIRRVSENTAGPVVVIAPDADRASQIYSDLNTLGVSAAREFRLSLIHI